MAAQADLCLAWSETPEDTFSHDEAQLFMFSLFVLQIAALFVALSKCLEYD